MGCAQWVRGESHVMQCREITVIDPQDQLAPLPKGGCQRQAGVHSPQQWVTLMQRQKAKQRQFTARAGIHPVTG